MISASPTRASDLMMRAGSPSRGRPPTSAAVATSAMTHGLERKIRRVEDAERRAGVPHVREIEQTRE